MTVFGVLVGLGAWVLAVVAFLSWRDPEGGAVLIVAGFVCLMLASAGEFGP